MAGFDFKAKDKMRQTKSRHNVVYLSSILIIVVILTLLLFTEVRKSEELVGKACQICTSSNWVKYSQNPLISQGKTKSWDHGRGDPFVMRDGTLYKMWFGANNEKAGITQVGYAESYDGIKWNMHSNPVLTPGTIKTHDATVVETPIVIKDETEYHMWYSSVNKFGGDGDESIYRIGHAVSQDGINWKKDANNPVVRPEGNYLEGNWSSWGVLEPTVIKEDGIYKMWFMGISAKPPDYKTIHYEIGYATSVDGSEWQPYSNNPVLEIYKGPYENKVINSAFFVLNDGKKYRLFYFGGDVPDIVADSKDGINWKKHEKTILPNGEAGSWDSWIVSSPTIIFDEGKYKMWYSGGRIDENFNFHFGIGHATNDGLK